MARREYFAVVGVVILFTALLFPALMYARQETRDGIRRDEIAAFKQVMEHYYNQHETYPLEFDARPHQYVVVEKDARGATSWFLRAELENSHPTGSAYDAEEGRNFYYRYIQNQGKTFYEVCGGVPACEIPSPETE